LPPLSRIDNLPATDAAALMAACGLKRITFGDMREMGVRGVGSSTVPTTIAAVALPSTPIAGPTICGCQRSVLSCRHAFDLRTTTNGA
jgi:hypothetical protein